MTQPTDTHSGGHYIEDAVKVHLAHGPEGWRASVVSVDGEPLDRVDEDGTTNAHCGCGDPDGCRRVTEHAALQDPPSGLELITLLARAAADEGEEGGPARDWAEFREVLRMLRKEGYAVANRALELVFDEPLVPGEAS